MEKHRCQSAFQNTKPFCPKRLVEVASENSPARLRDEWELPTEFRASPEYLCLSYCWGGDQAFKLRKGKVMDTYREALPYDHLPQTLKDALTATKSLGYRYIWIDSLCIIQDDEQDKVEQLPLMPAIYEGATVTIVAARASSCREGFLQPLKPSFVYPNGTFFLPYHPVDSRAWILQEEVLSPRLIVYGSTALWWSCPCERKVPYRFAGKDNWPLWEDPPAFVNPFYDWAKIIEIYSRRQLTMPDDKLVAVAGLAAAYARSADNISEKLEYLAGIWRHTLPYGLLWRVDDHRHPRPVMYRAPTWSWASVNGEINYQTIPREKPDSVSQAKVLQCTVEPRSADFRYGAIASGTLKFDGVIRHAYLVSIVPEAHIVPVEVPCKPLQPSPLWCVWMPWKPTAAEGITVV
ncbi:HET-domain-containing protein [Trematosphaeria pertusa]|uniref:HET-domain-containing protein n=1 Tax=Trematosphaeria pertusa TaxID=390896 RepID=A0A6A6HSM8_9PLEO|nr:HET-domain-containing protein [Trematosphaeria pertusa]KAF2240899.1 HET-domain-containing protein [Trematosphaeria pertusa]